MTSRGGVGSKIGSAFIEVGASFVGFGQGLASDVTNAILYQGAVVGNALESFGQAVFAKFSVPLLAATAANIAQFQALDREVRTVLTLFGTAPSLVDDTFREMADGIRSVSESVGGLEKDIAQGLYQTISAGIPRGDAFEFLDVAQMASIADQATDLTTAVDGLSTVVNAFGLEAADTTEIADAMFRTVALGKTTFGQLSADIGRVAPLAANAGVAFQELLAVSGSLTLQGLQTSEAISFIRAAITGLLRPTEELNVIFNELGFSSAEAAVPVIGLQGAFQAVVDAAGGSTSKLQELIGTSEGVSAILGVTGENAETFSRILGGIENSAGATQQAFEIMDDSVSRTFGKMTEAFDRLGNTFGEMAAGFAAPVIEGATGILNNMIDVFENLRPLVGGLVTGFKTFFKVIDIPVLKDVAAILGTIAVTISGMLGGLGLVSLSLGKIIVAGLKLGPVVKVVQLLGTAATGVRIGFLGASDTLGAFGKRLKDTNKYAAGAVTGLGRISRLLSLNPVAFAGALGLVVAALGAIALAVGKAINDTEEYIASQEVFRKGTDKLLESLGLVNQAIVLPGADEGKSALATFTEENLDTLRVLQQTSDELGRLKASDLAEALAVEFVFRGNAPEEVLEAIETIENASGLSINLDLADLQDGAVLIEQFAEGVLVAGERLANTAGVLADGRINRSTTEITAQLNNLSEGFLTLFQAGRAQGDPTAFIDTLESVTELLGDNERGADKLGKALNDIFFEEFGVDLIHGLERASTILDPEVLLARLREEGLGIEPIEIPIEVNPSTGFNFLTEGLLKIDPAEIIPSAEVEAQLTRAKEIAQELGITVQQAVIVGEDGANAYQDLASRTTDLFAGVKDQVLGAFETIRSGVEAQMPLLDLYSGAIEQSFDEWKTGQDQFQEDIAAVTTLRKTLVDANLPQELIAAFDRTPLDQQAWLAGLGKEDLDAAIVELGESFGAVETAGTERITQSIDNIMFDAGVSITTGYNELAGEAAEKGPIVASAFNTNFGIGAANWAITAQTYIDALSAQLSNAVIQGPTVGPLRFTSGGELAAPGSTVIAPTFNNPTSHNSEEDARRTLAVLQTSQTSTSRFG